MQKQKSDNLFTMFYKNMNKRKGPEPHDNKSSKNTEKSEGEKRLSKCGCTKFSPV